MKLHSLPMAALAAMMLTGCGGKNTQTQEAVAAQEEQQPITITRDLSARLDSLTSAWLQIQQTIRIGNTPDGKLQLPADVKKVKPTFLLDPEYIQPNLETLSLKYRALAVYEVDKAVADLYDMVDVYSPAIKRIIAQINDPALERIRQMEGSREELVSTLYAMEEEAGRASMFWQMTASTLIEQFYILTQSEDVILASLTDKDADELSFHLSVLIDAYEEMASFEPELDNLYKVLKTMQEINAATVTDLRIQMDAIKGDIANARKALFL